MKKIYIIIVMLIASCTTFLGEDVGSSNSELFDHLYTEFKHNYALFDVKGINWDELYNKYSPMVSDDMSEEELFELCTKMLEPLNDSHVALISGFNYYSSGPDKVSYFDIRLLDSYLDEKFIVGNSNMIYGRIGRTGYLYIKSFLAEGLMDSTLLDWAYDIDRVIEYFIGLDSVVVDIRKNPGGLTPTALYIASRFTESRSPYMKLSEKIGPGKDDFTEEELYYVEPDGERQYTKRVFLVTDGETGSAAEDFSLAMLTQPHVVHIGEGTLGIYSLSLRKDMPNGWMYSVSVQKIVDSNGVCYEGVGIVPQEENRVILDKESAEKGVDSQLEFIINRINTSSR